jgi:hypothetical protein
MENSNLYTKIHIQKLIIVALAVPLFSCTSAVPSISGFMNPKSEGFVNTTVKFGDICNENYSYDDPYCFEYFVDVNAGASLKFKNVAFGLEYGSPGLKSTLGFRNNYFGTVIWGGIGSPTMMSFTYGAAIAEQYPSGLLDSALRFGVFEYLDRSSYPLLIKTLFSDVVGYKYYYESGLGIYGAFKIKKKSGLAVEYRIGRQIETHEIRQYIDLKVFYSFTLL